MAEAGEPVRPIAPGSPAKPFIYDWVHPSVLHYASEYTSLDPVEPFSRIVVAVGDEGCAVVEPCEAGEPVCYRAEFPGRVEVPEQFTFMYETIFSKLGVRFPLTDFECDVLRTLNIAPTQLHPNGWGFIRAFAIVCRGLGSDPSVGRFFIFFQAKASPKVTWTSLNNQPRRGLLIAVTQSYKDFKRKFFRVKAGPRCPNLLVDQLGKERFPLYWTKGPLGKLGHDYRWLTDEEKEDVAILECAAPMKCSDLFRLADDEEALFAFLCILLRYLQSPLFSSDYLFIIFY